MQLNELIAKLEACKAPDRERFLSAVEVLFALPERNREGLYLKVIDEAEKVKHEARGWMPY